MKITEKQRKIIDGLRCVRLSSDMDHLRMVDHFFVSKNPSLANPLQNEAYSDDEEGKIAYYVVKSSHDEILFYFSLKCGTLYDKYKDEDIVSYKKFVFGLEKIQMSTELSDEDRETISLIRERLRIHKGITTEQLLRFKNTNGVIGDMKSWLERNSRMAGETFAGIEIVHFVANEEYSDLWNSWNVGQKLGVVVFWQFIVPIIEKVKELVGCQYVFLFAADSTPDETLVNYYRSMLEFDDMEDRNATVPIYDFSCKLMYQEIGNLYQRRSDFFEHFNRDDEMV